MSIQKSYTLIIVIIVCGLFSCVQDSVSKESKKNKTNFSLSIMTFNHAQQFYNGITTYKLIKDTLTIHKSFKFSDNDTLLFSKKLDNNSIDKIKDISLNNLEEFYLNRCIMPTSGNEYFITTSYDSVNKKISIHHFYNEQIETLINELNKNIPDNFKLDYLTKDNKQDCKR